MYMCIYIYIYVCVCTVDAVDAIQKGQKNKRYTLIHIDTRIALAYSGEQTEEGM